MGIVLRLLRWLWRWFGNYNNAVSLADLLDYKTAIAGGIGFVVMTIFGALNYQWSPQIVVSVALFSGACISVIFIGLRLLVESRSGRKEFANTETSDQEFSDYVPDVRIADSNSVASLFDGDKLIPLLEAGKLTCWARPMGSGHPPPIKVPGGIWRTHTLRRSGNDKSDIHQDKASAGHCLFRRLFERSSVEARVA